MRPAPGTAAADDVARIRDHEKSLFELVDGVLVEKVSSFRESMIAAELGRLIGNYVVERDIGIVLAADGMMRLFLDTVRINDVAFIAWDRLPAEMVPAEAIPTVAPNLVIEVLSESNTPSEMKRKRADYFGSGVELVWEVDCDDRTVTVYTAPDTSTKLTAKEVVTGSHALTNFELPLATLFAKLDHGSP